MLNRVFANHDTGRRLRSERLGPHLDSFAAHLAQCGYAAASVQSRLALLGHFDQWLVRHRCRIDELTDERVGKFLNDWKRRGRLHRGHATTLRQLLAHLCSQGVVASPAPLVNASPLDQLQRDYAQHLRVERGLAPATVMDYCRVLRWFLTDRFGDNPLDLQVLDVSTITTFVVRRASTMSPRYAQILVTALRSICRFLWQRGAVDRNLAAGVPSVPDWRLATIPKYLEPEEVERVLHACDRHTATGRRNYAILLLLARLGLRAGEILALELDDIHWRAGEIVVRSSKRLPQDRLPLLKEVGEALATYLRQDRPSHPTRRVFLCMKAPRRGLANPSTVSTIVRRALAHAGLSPAFTGAHLFRHSLATRMLRQGATLSEIGQVLRHRAVGTTEIYAKVDLAGLRALAHPWPQMGGAQ